jgi:hypothetical protein
MSSFLSMRVRVLFLTVHMIYDYRAHGAGAFLRSSTSLGYRKPYGEVVLVRRFFIPNFFGTKDPRPAPRTWTGKPNCSSTLRSDSISTPSDQGHRPPMLSSDRYWMRIDTVSDPIRSLTQLLLCSANATVHRTQRRGGTTSKSSKALENRFFKTCRYYYPWFNQLCVIEDNKAYMIIFHHYTNFLIFVSSLVHQTLQSKKILRCPTAHASYCIHKHTHSVRRQSQ